jgi:hypothetical protein
LAGPGVGQDLKKTSQSEALWRLVFGRQEIEGVLGKSRTTGFIRIGVSTKASEHG